MKLISPSIVSPLSRGVSIGCALVTIFCFIHLSSDESQAKDDVSMANQVMQSTLPPELTSMFPVGREFYGVAIPSYTEEKLKSVMRADTVVRINERFLDLTNLIVFIYNGKGEQETTIQMDKAVYDLNLGQLESKTPSKIEQEQFTMTGDVMTFESQSQVSHLRGNVRVVIPDASGFTPDFESRATKTN